MSGTTHLLAPYVNFIALDVASVATGGVAVTALKSGRRSAGGWIQNPATASSNLGINEQGTASATDTTGATTYIVPGQTYYLAPSPNPVSVVSSDSGHNFTGWGFQ